VSAASKCSEIEDRAADLRDDIALRFRIGIHLGDVVVQGSDLATPFGRSGLQSQTVTGCVTCCT
jgi:class 3 adenylate cyclase